MIYKGMLIFINEMVREINDLLERFFYKLWTVAVNLSILYANDFFRPLEGDISRKKCR